MKIAVVGSINTDIVAVADQYPGRGDKMFGRSVEILSGGMGANQATTCAKLGKEAVLIGCVGRDVFGDRLIDTLHRNGVDISRIKRADHIHTGVALITIDETAENTILVVKGANDALAAEDIDRCAAEIEQCRVMLVQMEVPEEAVIQAMTKARASGLCVILDPAPAEGVTVRTLDLADVVIPNRQEARHLTGIDPVDAESALDAARYFAGMGVKQSIIKMGEGGALVYVDGQWEHVEAVPIFPVDTSGAGDVFAGALACALADGQDLFAAARFATIAAALKVGRMGAQAGIPTLQEVNDFCRERRLTHYLMENHSA
ncbi:ribokinase [Brevibacillus sp. B_LB10_24]|uniref:ribokinase n=1 Tax=Brevibacillus sp. B_LB10_24 TaxID=3380645 RepID=UPI0038B757BE